MNTSTNKTAAVIPFYNEKKFIEKIIGSVLPYTDMIIAVDDGSTDGTAGLIKKSDKITVISHQTNLGKGAALNTGFRKSIEMGFDYTITIDADLQHDPSYIPALLKEKEKYDIVIGNRLHTMKDMPYSRRLSNFLTSTILTLKTGSEIKDSQCGFRVYRTSILADILPEFTGFEAESEILINAARNNLKIGFADIPTIYGEEESKMKNKEAILGFLKVVFKK